MSRTDVSGSGNATDPENMLAAEKPVRVFHDEMNARFSLDGMVVVSVVNETNPDGVFNVDSITLTG